MKSKTHRVIAFSILLVLYILTSALVIKSGTSSEIVNVLGKDLPVSAFTGVFSAFVNLFTIFMVLYFSSTGFIIAVALMLLQFATMIPAVYMGQSIAAISGLFTNSVTLITIVAIYRRKRKIAELKEVEVQHAKAELKLSQHLFEQTATSLVNAIDAKDTYSHGHSLRVAEYSERIARELGKSDEECYKIYYAALLHDVGKIGIPDSIIGNPGKLTPEEYDAIKQHPVMGNQILSSINEYPYLSIGAHYHHERYDGKGYPDGLKGDDIPEIARIISVADAYDAMSSNRSYRNAIPQQLVREEIIKGAGTQFDPRIAMIMQHLIDVDTEYRMKERDAVNELAGRNDLECREYRSEISDGVLLSPFVTHIHMELESLTEDKEDGRGPAVILFDSLDGRVHDEERTIRDLIYFEYCEIWMDGSGTCKGARDMQTNVSSSGRSSEDSAASGKTVKYDIEACKYKDHVQILIDDGENLTEVITALPDSSRYVYLSLTGEHCHISEVKITKDDSPIPADRIHRIAEEISYLDGPEGDIPNIQIDGHRTASTAGIELKDKLEISFHTMSLPTARLIWHCPYFVVFTSRDGQVYGEGYTEYAIIRLDGELCEAADHSASISHNDLIVRTNDDFVGWDAWKKHNKDGIDCTVTFSVYEGNVTTITENLGVMIHNTTTIKNSPDKIYVAITGDQCALTNIRIK